MNDKDLNIKEKIVRAYKTGGLGVLLYRVFKKTRKVLFGWHTSYWYVRKLSESSVEIIPNITVDINYHSIEETLKWEKDNLHNGIFYCEETKEIRTARQNNHYFLNVTHNNKIIGFLKIALHKTYFKEYLMNISVPPNLVFIYDTFIHPDYRGKKIALYMINESMKMLKAQGRAFIMCHIVPSNHVSQKIYTKIGFRKIGCIFYLRFLGIKIFNFHPERLMKNFDY
ncbi:MAG: GNAT family N-acetyltransferase [Candidatus Omnitrophota bacterium]